MWSAAFTAAVGGNSAQSSKFMKLMGIKNAPAEADNVSLLSDSFNLSIEGSKNY